MTAGVSCQPSMVTLVDGTRVLNDSEEWRHECEARTILNMPDRGARHDALYGPINPKTGQRYGGVKGKRGEAELARLEAKILELWAHEKASKECA